MLVVLKYGSLQAAFNRFRQERSSMKISVNCSSFEKVAAVF